MSAEQLIDYLSAYIRRRLSELRDESLIREVRHLHLSRLYRPIHSRLGL